MFETGTLPLYDSHSGVLLAAKSLLKIIYHITHFIITVCMRFLTFVRGLRLIVHRFTCERCNLYSINERCTRVVQKSLILTAFLSPLVLEVLYLKRKPALSTIRGLTWIEHCSLASKHHRYINPCQLHKELRSGLQAKFRPGTMFVSFYVQQKCYGFMYLYL